MNKYEQREMMKKTTYKKHLVQLDDWLINYIPELIKNGGCCERQNYESF